ncbi:MULTISPECIES: flagellar biosynthesis protein FliQ [Bowmanella]|uniref:Flagellar biosynthetic protein FliQ n=2 Tax=Bowmanella TaxID=366580 RepID=A0A918DF86_9ALTE|nr:MULTISPECIES: flagellar biosynthesis protein FliQ [Bowmanella]MBN7820474.1 flagellar biosynthesis protein FliQ [Bowmanella yangjiangensis]MBT1064935.1 flagellar biosynthesis protein FliQ [Bowmanella yangjiangensis]GGO63502.1 flagellar export apparatus protein FliQ [Bowmanella pacifica]
MSPEIFVDILREALFMVILLVSAIILPSLFVGLIVSVFQAATSINEQTINFLPRLIVTLLALSWGGHWLTGQLMDFFFEMVNRIPEVVG